ncbi:MAG: hypothetical protein ACC645_25045 [Pirellulales bacterium]
MAKGWTVATIARSAVAAAEVLDKTPQAMSKAMFGHIIVVTVAQREAAIRPSRELGELQDL